MEMQIVLKNENIFYPTNIFKKNLATFLFSPFEFPILSNFKCWSGSFSFTVASQHFYPYFAKLFAKQHSESSLWYELNWVGGTVG
jgi:hypothetical protein